MFMILRVPENTKADPDAPDNFDGFVEKVGDQNEE